MEIYAVRDLLNAITDAETEAQINLINAAINIIEECQ